MPLYALRREFPDVRRADLHDVLRRFRRVKQRRRRRWQSRLDWRSPGTVWAADFKERPEPLEGRYGSILSIKDLASRYQLAWLPLEEATAPTVQAMYERLFAEHGPPLVLKSDNGGQFRDEGTKALLAAHRVTPLYSPKRRPSYNGGVERANGQLAGYQEALAESRGRAGLPNCEDAESARRLANDLARRDGLRGGSAAELWAARAPISATARASFLATVEDRRAAARAQWNFAPDEPLSHYPQAAVDRRAVRDALLAHDLLHILPRHPKRGERKVTTAAAPDFKDAHAPSLMEGAPAQGALRASDDEPLDGPAPRAQNPAPAMLASQSAGRIETSEITSPMVGEDTDRAQPNAGAVQPSTEEAPSSTNKLSASGQHYG